MKKIIKQNPRIEPVKLPGSESLLPLLKSKTNSKDKIPC